MPALSRWSGAASPGHSIGVMVNACDFQNFHPAFCKPDEPMPAQLGP